jgi:MarR family transcriptional regulator, temperature-dependent positive regulator of motility
MSVGHSFLTEKEEVLNILREIKANPGLTQRQMSVLLGVSLGKVNFLLRALIEKGFIKAHNFKNADNKSAYLYLLTPRGIEEKTRITYYFLKQKTEEYDRLKEEIRQLQAEVEPREHSAQEL